MTDNHHLLSATRRSMTAHMIAAGCALSAMVIGVGGWAATAQVAGAVIAPGSLVVEGNLKRVQHPTGGVVGELRVRDGEAVREGDVLIRLDETQTRANLAIITRNIDELAARRARLEAERDIGELVFPSQLVERAANEPEVERVLAGERRLFESRREARRGQQAQLRERIAQLQQQINGTEEQVAAKRLEIQFIATELQGVRELARKNLVPIQRLTALERDGARLGGDNGALLASIAQTRMRITETELQILQIDQDLRSEVGRELGDIRAKLSELGERKIAAEDQLRRVELRAPYDGVVHQLNVHTVGGVISAGETVMLIVPASDSLSVEVRLAPETIDQVRTGQDVNLRFSAFNQRTTPEVRGRVARISADLSSDPRLNVSYYVARIEIPEAEIQSLGHRLKPGMPVEAFIQTGDRTVLTYLTKPVSDQMQRAFRER